MRRNDDELSFEEIMSREGVEPLSTRAATLSGVSSLPRAAKSGPQSRPQSDPKSRPNNRQTTVISSPSISSPDDAESERARARDTQRVREVTALKARAEAAEAALTEAKQSLAQAREQVRDLAGERHKLDERCRQLDERCRQLSESVRGYQRDQATPVSMRSVLAERGLRDEHEMLTAVRGLLDLCPGKLLDDLELTAPDALRRLLEQRTVLVNQPDSDLDDTCVSIPVTPERCELTGGSDIRAAFNDLARACQSAAVRVITIVGGSPAYRQQLKILAEAHGLPLNLVSGTQRRTRKRAEADMRKSDVVVIWGATELDHSVSGVYTSGAAPILRSPHRGISRMLAHLTQWLQTCPKR